MREFYDKLKKQVEENPLMAIAIGAAVLTGIAKFVDAAGHARGSHAYARDVNRRIRQSR